MSPPARSVLCLVAAVSVSCQLFGCALPMEGETRPEEPVGVQLASLSDYSCGERSDTGYVRGEPFSIDVVTVQDRPVEVSTANAYIAMATAAEADGVSIRIVSGFRTNDEQRYLYNCYTSCSCNSCNLAARPGYSNHQSGHALDLNTSSAGVLRWLEANGARFGFSRTVPSENWHWEFWGDDPGAGPCGVIEPPTRETCPPIPSDGAVVEETSGCFFAHGPAAYWRSEGDAGHGGALLWTHAFRSDTPSNWARWYLDLEAADAYTVQIWAEPGFAIHRAARYAVRHAGVDDEIEVDLNGASGWVELGTFDFDTGADQHVSLYDHSPVDIADGQRLPADAIRLVRPSEEPTVDDPTVDEPTVDEPPVDDPGVVDPGVDDPGVDDPDASADPSPSDGPTALRGTCHASAGPSPSRGSLGWLGALAVALLLRRRSASRRRAARPAV